MVIELSGGQFGLKSYAWFQNRMSAQREFDFFSQVWFQTKIARHEVQLPFLHPFWNCPNTGLGQFKYFIDAVLSRSEIKVTHFLREKSKSFGNKSCKICHNLPLFVFHFSVSCVAFEPWNLIGCFAFNATSSLAGKKNWFRAKNGAIRE